MSIEKGKIIESHAKYEVGDRIGEGNYGTVFLARHQELGRDVAIKVLSNGEENLSNLQRESWVQGRLSHPNIVSIYDFTVVDKKGCLVMEYVEKSLQKILEECSISRKPVPLEFALRVIRDCLNGLAQAQDASVVHGDIKPANILIGNDGSAKLSDFGVARLLGTAVKSIKGSAKWAAPEVLRSWKRDNVWVADYQSDLFSIGVLAYLLLTGRHPFIDPGGVLSIAQVILREEITVPFPKRKGKIIPERYATVTMRLIQRNKKQRYTSAGEVLVDLQEQPMAPCSGCGDQNPVDAPYCNWCAKNLRAERIAALPREERVLFKAHDHFTAGQADKGFAKIEEFLESDKESAEKWCDIGYKFNSLGWYKDAVVVCTKAIDLNPELVHPYQTRGFAKSCLGDFKESIDDFNKALEFVEKEDKRKKSQILYQRGFVWMRMSKKDKACKDAKNSFELNPEFTKALWLIGKTCNETERS